MARTTSASNLTDLEVFKFAVCFCAKENSVNQSFTKHCRSDDGAILTPGLGSDKYGLLSPGNIKHAKDL